MKMILAGSANELFDPVLDLRVVVAYQNSALALRARALLERVAQAAARPGRLIYSLWDFTGLAEPALLPIACQEALAADIIVVAAVEGKALPKGVRDWVARWLRKKNDLPQALVASLHPDPEQTPAPPVVRPYLAGVAEHGKMQFFASPSDGHGPVAPAEAGDGVGRKSRPAGQAVFPLPAPPAGASVALTNLYATMPPAAHALCRAAA